MTDQTELTAAEKQSGHDRVQWAESLIVQLPKTHDGRNSWLLNFGRSEEARRVRVRWHRRFAPDGICERCDGAGEIDTPYSGSDPSCPECSGEGLTHDRSAEDRATPIDEKFTSI